MSINISDIIKDLIPIKIKQGGKLDSIVDGISEFIEDGILSEVKNISTVRDPGLTVLLDELEKDHGLINDSELTDEERRRFLSVFALSKNGNGSREFLQTRLRNAGFSTVNVIENSPALDPNIFLDDEYSFYCGDNDAYCGDENAILGTSPGGYLLVDGVNTYDIPEDDRGNFVFFIGGAATGWILISDSNMELPGIEHWTEDVGTLAFKDSTIHVSGLQSLRVEDNNSLIEQEPYPLSDDPDLVDAYRFYDLDLALGRKFSKQIRNHIFDWDMETADYDMWEVTAGTSVVKYGTSYQSGSRSLSVSITDAVYDYTYQDILTVGKTYVANFFFKSNGVANPLLKNGDLTIYTGSVSDINWHGFEFEFTATDSKIGISSDVPSTTFFIDNFLVYEKPVNALSNGDFELDGSSWLEYGSPVYGFPTDCEHVTGTRCLALEPGANGLYQSALTRGKKYKVTGYCRGTETEGTHGVPVIHNGFDNEIFRLSDHVYYVYKWYEINFEFVATDTVLYITNDSDYDAYFDKLCVEEIYDHRIQNIGYRQLIYDGNMSYFDASMWSDGNDAILSKQTGVIYDTEYLLNVAYDGTPDAYAYQTVPLEEGATYKITGWGKGSSISGFGVSINGDLTVYPSSAWGNFSKEITVTDSTDNELRLYSYTNSAGGYALFGLVSVVRVDGNHALRKDKENILFDGYCEDSNTGCWTVLNGTISKTTSDYYSGSRALLVTMSGSGYTIVYQNVLVVGKKYKLSGYVKTSSSAADSFHIDNYATVLWNCGASASWQFFCIEFTATNSQLSFVGERSLILSFVMDYVYLEELCPENINIENIFDGGDFEDGLISDKIVPNTCDLTIDSDSRYGSYSLRATGTAPIGAYIVSYHVEIGKRYKLSGFVKLQDYTVSSFTIEHDSSAIWSQLPNSFWQYFYADFTATDTTIDFISDHNSSYFLLDNIFLREVPGGQFNGTNNVDNIGRSLLLENNNKIENIEINGLSDLSISFDIFGDVISDNDKIITVNSQNPVTNTILVDSGILYIYDSPHLYPIGNILDGRWHNVVYSYDSTLTALKAYFDGELVVNISFTFIDAFDYISVCNTNGDGSLLIQNIFVYNQVKTASDVSLIYDYFISVLWGGSVMRNNLSGTSNVSHEIVINDKVPPSDIHLLPGNVDLVYWQSVDRNEYVFDFIGIVDWRTRSATTVYLTFKGMDGSSVNINWGDGNYDDIDMLGDSISINVDNAYSLSGYKKITPTGDLLDVDYIKVTDAYVSTVIDSFFVFENLSYLDLSGCPVGIGDESCTFGSGIEIRLTDCDLSDNEIDRLLIKLYNASVANLTLYLNGVNGVRTSLSDTAYAWLIANGATIISSYNVTISDVDTDEIITSTQLNVVITGTDYLPSQGAGKVEICDNSDYASATIIQEQSYDSWSDTSIQIDIVVGTLLDDL